MAKSAVRWGRAAAAAAGWALLGLAACAPTRPWRAALMPPSSGPTATARVEVVFVSQTPTPAPAAPAARCAQLVPVCWNDLERAQVAHICFDEAQGLLRAGMASCAATIARRQTEPEWFGGPALDELLVWDQFRVDSALTRPWARGVPAPAAALEAVDAFLADERGEGCWGYDSFRGVTPELAQSFVAEAPERRCAVIRAPQAMVFLDWRNR